MQLKELEQRVIHLEREFAALKAFMLPKPTGKNWQTTFDMFANDPGMEEVLRLGREYREQQNRTDDENAGA